MPRRYHGRMDASDLLKRDTFGHIERIERDGVAVVRRDTRSAVFGLRRLAQWAAAREARALERLSGLECVPQLLGFDGCVLERSYLPGRPMQEAQPRDVAYYRAAWRLLRAMRARGVVHNDLAKEPNWLVTQDARPALVDFQLAACGDPRGRWFRLQAREDLRHLLKHKRTYCGERLTPVELRLLARKSWLARAWHGSFKRGYRWLTSRLGWRDNEGRG